MSGHAVWLNAADLRRCGRADEGVVVGNVRLVQYLLLWMEWEVDGWVTDHVQ